MNLGLGFLQYNIRQWQSTHTPNSDALVVASMAGGSLPPPPPPPLTLLLDGMACMAGSETLLGREGPGSGKMAVRRPSMS